MLYEVGLFVVCIFLVGGGMMGQGRGVCLEYAGKDVICLHESVSHSMNYFATQVL